MTERKPNLRSVRELTPTLQFRTIHGYRRAFRVAGSGPAILLIHGIGDNSTTWSTVQTKLAQRFTVIAPDLLGHGASLLDHQPEFARQPRIIGQPAKVVLCTQVTSCFARIGQDPHTREITQVVLDRRANQ